MPSKCQNREPKLAIWPTSMYTNVVNPRYVTNHPRNETRVLLELVFADIFDIFLFIVLKRKIDVST